MKISFDCIPCFLRQAAETINMAATSVEDRNQMMHEVLQWMAGLDLNQTPPAAAQIIHRRLRRLLPSDDPYRPAKDRQNKMAALLLPSIRRYVLFSPDPLTMAVRFAITGNIIDLGAKNKVGFGDIYAELQSAPFQPIFGNMETFKKAVSEARTILYLADNAGEIFFDRLLIEQLAGKRIMLAVRGAPVINDATLSDAQLAGMEDIAEVIDNGSDAPGTILEDCSSDFQRRFAKADLIIAKGQGNFESLAGRAHNIFFLFRAKCPVISLHSGFSVGSYVAANSFKSLLPSSAGDNI